MRDDQEAGHEARARPARRDRRRTSPTTTRRSGRRSGASSRRASRVDSESQGRAREADCATTSTHGRRPRLARRVRRAHEGGPGRDLLRRSANRATRCSGSPHLEALQARGYEVLFMTDPVDTWAAGAARVQGKKLVNAMRADLKLPADDEEKKQKEEQRKGSRALIVTVKEVARRTTSREVRVSERPRGVARVPRAAGGAMPAHLERLLRERGKELPRGKRILELNPTHPAVRRSRRSPRRTPTDPAARRLGRRCSTSRRSRRGQPARGSRTASPAA